MQVRKSSPQSDSDLPGPATLPTEAEVRAADLEREDTATRDGDVQPDPARDQAEADAGAVGQSDAATESREERIRRAAYALYQKRGSSPGSDLDDWLEAERTVGREDADERGTEPSR